MPPRLLPDIPLPPYTFVPGRAPHPVRDPDGHLFGQPPTRPAPLDPTRWQDSRDYLHGIDLFNEGYYWEAHEVWEGLWHAAGRTGVTADLLKGLIQLTAAGVKVRQGVPAGVASLAAGSADLFRGVAQALGGPDARHLGLRLGDLIDFARGAGECCIDPTDTGEGVRVVFDFILCPEWSAP
jgi:hypothetical protein